MEQIPSWTPDIVRRETKRMFEDPGHERMIELLCSDIESDKFVHNMYVNIAREIWYKPDLLYHGHKNSVKQKNFSLFKDVVSRMIPITLRKLNPSFDVQKGGEYSEELSVKTHDTKAEVDDTPQLDQRVENYEKSAFFVDKIEDPISDVNSDSAESTKVVVDTSSDAKEATEDEETGDEEEPKVDAVGDNKDDEEEPKVDAVGDNNDDEEEPKVDAVGDNKDDEEEPKVDAVGDNNDDEEEPKVDAVGDNNNDDEEEEPKVHVVVNDKESDDEEPKVDAVGDNNNNDEEEEEPKVHVVVNDKESDDEEPKDDAAAYAEDIEVTELLDDSSEEEPKDDATAYAEDIEVTELLDDSSEEEVVAVDKLDSGDRKESKTIFIDNDNRISMHSSVHETVDDDVDYLDPSKHLKSTKSRNEEKIFSILGRKGIKTDIFKDYESRRKLQKQLLMSR